MIWKKFLSYLTFWKKQPAATEGATNSIYVRMMHGINKISILIFLIGIIVIIYRLFVR